MSSEPQCGEMGGCGVSANEYSCAHGAQINFGDLTLFLTKESISVPLGKSGGKGLDAFLKKHCFCI